MSLQLNNITKTYGKRITTEALKGINLSVKDGEFLGIMGPSGSGKTTLLNIIATIDHPTSGSVLINSQDPHAVSENQLALFRRRELGIVFQSYNLLDTLTVRENIAMPMALEKKSVNEIDSRVKELAALLGISHLLDKMPYEISGGEAQRTAIGRAVVNKPSLLLADEPTGNLDSKSSTDVMSLLSKLNKEEGVTTVLVTHEAQAASYCERVIFIKDGGLNNEINKGDNDKQFFQQIMDVLTFFNTSI